MDADPRIYLTIFAILLYLAAWFAVTETALASVSKNKLKLASERGDYRADDALYALDSFDRAITTILICTNILHISAASLITVFVTRNFGLSWVSLATIITTILVFFFGEMLPKCIAKKTPEKFVLSNCKILVILMKLLYPLSSLLASIGSLTQKITKSEPELSVTEEELHDIIEDLEEEGTLDEDESELIQSAIEFSDQKINNILTPREKIVAIDINIDLDSLKELASATTHSRIPVYENKLDNIIGILNLKEFMIACIKNKDFCDLKCLITPALIVSKNYNIDDILSLMSEKKSSLALVKRNKTIIGLISMEDILEELVGEIYDEDELNTGGTLC